MMDTFLKPYVTINRNQIISLPDKPKFIGHFSIDYPFESSQIRLDASNCKYFKKQLTYTKELLLDLSEFDTYREDYVNSTHQRYEFSRMPVLLEYLKSLVLKDGFIKHSDKQLFWSDIICDQSFLYNVLRVPGDSGHKFAFLCTKYKGNIYICKHKLKNKPREYDSILIRHVLCTDKPQSDTNSSIPGFAKFFGVYNMQLKNVAFMYCAALRGINSETEINAATDFNDVTKVDFFLHKRNEPLKQGIFSKYVSPSWWCRLFLQGADEMHIAEFRDCSTVDKIETINLTAFLQEYEKKWSKSTSERVSFLNVLVDFIILRMTFINCPLTVYKFDYDPKINKSIQYSVHKGRNEFTFLNDEYISLIKDL